MCRKPPKHLRRHRKADCGVYRQKRAGKQNFYSKGPAYADPVLICCARLPPRQGGNGRFFQPIQPGKIKTKYCPGARPMRNRPPACCARLAPARGQWVLSSTIQPGKNKNAASGTGLCGTGNPICCARLAPRQGGDGHKKCSPGVGLCGTGPLSAAPDWPPARGAMGTKNAAPRAGLCGTGAGLLRRKEKDEGKKEGDALKKIRTGGIRRTGRTVLLSP